VDIVKHFLDVALVVVVVLLFVVCAFLEVVFGLVVVICDFSGLIASA
jgi:hypothetical protein